MASRPVVESIEINKQDPSGRLNSFVYDMVYMVADFHRLHTFHFVAHKNYAGRVDSRIVAGVLLHSKTLRTLDLQGFYACGDILASALLYSPFLECVQISNSEIHEIEDIVAALSTLPSLKNVRLCNVNYNSSDTRGLSHAFIKLGLSSSLEILDIQSHCLDGLDVIAMAMGIEHNSASALRELRLTNLREKSSDQALQMLGNMLLTNTTLVKLKFVAPLGEAEMMTPIIEALKVNRTLRVLCTNYYDGFLDSKFGADNSGGMDDAALAVLQVEAAIANEMEMEEENGGDDQVDSDEEDGGGDDDDDDDDDDDGVNQEEHGLSKVQTNIIEMLKHNDALEQLQSDVECVPEMSCFLNLNAAKRTFLLNNPLLHDAWLHTIIRFRRDPRVSFFFFSNNPGLISALVL